MKINAAVHIFDRSTQRKGVFRYAVQNIDQFGYVDLVLVNIYIVFIEGTDGTVCPMVDIHMLTIDGTGIHKGRISILERLGDSSFI